MTLTITYLGGDTNYFNDAFFDSTGTLSANPAGTPTSTQVVLTNPATGMTTTIAGSGFTFDTGGNITGGTVTHATFEQGGSTVATWSGISWSVTAFDAALVALESGDYAPLKTILAAQPIIIDGSSSTDAMRIKSFNGTLDTPLTISGSDFGDSILGGAGNDVIDTGASGSNYKEEVFGSAGNDTIIFSNITGFAGWAMLNYGYLGSTPVNATVNFSTNTGSVNKGVNGTDTLIDVSSPGTASWGGFGIAGTTGNDTFNVTSAANSWSEINGTQGADTYNIDISAGGIVQLDFKWGQGPNPAHGVDVNIGTGTIADDGYGNTETLNLIGGNGMLEIRGTIHSDTIVGGAGNDRFIGLGGGDTIDGGAGWDLMRYDRGIDFVKVNLAKGTAVGKAGGIKFKDNLAGVEQVRGSEGNDVLKGDGNDNALEGRGGKDRLIGGGGNDWLSGGDGGDRILGGGGRDRLFGDKGNDRLIGGNGNDRLVGGGGNDTLYGGKGRDVLVGNNGADKFVFRSGDGRDKIKGFADNIDTLVIDQTLNGGVATAADVVALAVDTGQNVIINFGGGDVLSLIGSGGNGTSFLLDDITIA